MNKNLVIVRAGEKSLHPQWLSDDRNWDIAVSYYGDFPERYIGLFDFFQSFKKTKWHGINYFISNNKDLIAKYDYIWMPDDDILTNCSNINDFFNICRSLDLTIAQPSLTQYSYYSWNITLQNTLLTARLTDFVEVMAPCFKTKHLHLFSTFFEENTSGFGYEWLWHKVAKSNNVNRLAIIDKTPIHHTRPIGSAGHGGCIGSPHKEMEILFAKYGLIFSQPTVLQEIL